MRKIVSLVLLAPLAGCGNGAKVGGQLVKSNEERLSAAAVDPTVVATQAAGNTQFAFDLYGQLKGPPGNLFFSPYSVSSALAMTWAGTAHTTASQMASALQFTQAPASVLGAFNALDAALTSRAKSGGTGEGGGPFELNVVNAIWTEQGLPLQAPFLDALAQNFGAGVRLEKFDSAPEAARADINAWVDDNTAGKIPMLMPTGSVTVDTRLVLTNAVYFNSSWETAFDPSHTQPTPFHALDGTTSTVPMMNTEYMAGRYAKGTGWQLVEIPYSNSQLTLTAIVPDVGQFAAVEAQLSGAFLTSAVAAEQLYDVTLGLPKFTTTTQADLAPAMQALGMTDAFTTAADFSGIDGQTDLHISTVVHQAVIDVDEKGTTAAAATGVGLAGSAAPIPVGSVTLTIDRPFFIILRDIPTQTALFVGRISQL